jgi:hypothetical protein
MSENSLVIKEKIKLNEEAYPMWIIVIINLSKTEFI